MLKKIRFAILVFVILSFITSFALASLANAAPMGAQEGTMGMMEEEAMEMHLNMGPLVAGQMIHVYFDILIFIISLILIVKIGSGKLRYPILVFALGYLLSAFIPIMFGHSYMWLVALVKSAFGLVGILWFIYIFGGMSLFFTKKENN